jgi:hypothetical protein
VNRTKLFLGSVAFVGAVAAHVSACNSSPSTGPGDGASDAKDGSVSTPCPSALPPQGGACSGGASCSYGEACNPTIAVCTGGFWENSPAVLADGGSCPMLAPAEGVECMLCAAVATCTYDSDCDEDGGSRITATCKSGTWTVASVACPLNAGDAGDAGPPADGGPDARADAPEDAHSDRDDARTDGAD